MPDLTSFDKVFPFLVLIVPGLVVVFVRSQFTTGRRPSHSASLLSYLTISVVYYAFILPFLDFVQPITAVAVPPAQSLPPLSVKILVWFFLVVFAGPALLGFFLGVSVQKDWFHHFLRWCRLNPVHNMPTAWDWKFNNMQPEWVLVVLKNGKKFGGFCDHRSFISSDPAERDIYISWVHGVGKDNKWHSRGNRSVLIKSDEISTITFWPHHNPRKEGTNG